MQKNIKPSNPHACPHCGKDTIDVSEPSELKSFIIRLVSRVLRVPRSKIYVQRRYREIVFPRQVIMSMLHEYTPLSLKTIGEEFGKDHTTVISAKRRVRDLYDTEEQTRRCIDFIKAKIEEKKREELVAA